MYRNILSIFGHKWIDADVLEELKHLPDCYIVEVTTFNSVQPIGINDITGRERNLAYINIYYKDKKKDKSPYLFVIDRFVDNYIIEDFRRNCEKRHRTKEHAEYRELLPTESDTKKLQAELKKRMLEVFEAEYESGKGLSGNSFICHRNQYKQLGLRKMLEFIRQADWTGIDIVISFDIENADADQIERTMNDLEIIDATVENEPLPTK